MVLLSVQLHLKVLYDTVLDGLACKLCDFLVQVQDLCLEGLLLRLEDRSVLLYDLQIVLFLSLQFYLKLPLQTRVSRLSANLQLYVGCARLRDLISTSEQLLI